MNILLIQPAFPNTFWSFKHALKYIRRKVGNPPLGLITVAAMLPNDWQKKLVDLNVSALEPKWIEWADYVMISAMNIQRASVVEVIQAVKSIGKPIIAGGPLFTGEHERFPEIDHFILNEAEITLPPFLEDLEKGSPKKVYQTDEYADITSTPLPAWELINFKAYESLNVQFSRGCPYNCDFCNVTALLGHRPRTKTAVQLIAELDAIYDMGWRRNIFIVDDNFIGNKKVLKQEILPALIDWRKGKKGCLFVTEVSINLSDDPELIDMMARAGFISLFVGIETPDEQGLESCNKNQNKNRDLIESVNILQRAGFQVMAGFIVGFDTDTPSIFRRQIEFIQKSGIVTAMVGLLQAPYGTRLYERMAAEGRLLDMMSGDNTDGSSNIIPKMNAGILKRGYQGILNRIYSPALLYERIKTFLRVYNPAIRTVRIEINEIYAFFRSMLMMGVFGEERKYYWKLFFWALKNKPRLFPMAITLTIYGYHFRKISNAMMQNTPAKRANRAATKPIPAMESAGQSSAD